MVYSQPFYQKIKNLNLKRLGFFFVYNFLTFIKKYNMFEEHAKNFSINCHMATNHFYDGLPYEFHLNMVVETAKKFIHLIPEKDHSVVLASCWAHDLIEDARVTYNDLKDELGEEVAEIVFAVTTEKGRNRKERANEKYYNGIRETKYADFVKICDRIANVEYSKNQSSSMFSKYKDEFENFEFWLYTDKNHEMFEHLYNLFNGDKYVHH
jgi:(p)ppGpp synthase/HD superfamily hydrolase